MTYQSFPWIQGDSRSFEKLVSLYLPVLKGKSLLDVGCNAGFFCGWASFQGACRVKGIDLDPKYIEQAKLWFEGPVFQCTSWERLGDEKFDVVLCLSALHYAEDQAALIDLLMDRVASGGMLVLELGIAQGSEEKFIEVERSIDSRKFPTRSMLHKMLEKYSFKQIGPSVAQAGDPVPRYVYHIQHRLPLAIVFMDGHYSGKTSIATSIFRPDIPRVSGDYLYRLVASGTQAAGPKLDGLIKFVPGTEHIDSASITYEICNQGLLPDLVELFAEQGKKKDFIIDSFIPEEYQDEFLELLEKCGYFTANVSLSNTQKNSWTRKRPPFSQYEAYIAHLQKIASIDEEAYLAANPDVARAVAEGKIPNAQVHYWMFGKREKRPLTPKK